MEKISGIKTSRGLECSWGPERPETGGGRKDSSRGNFKERVSLGNDYEKNHHWCTVGTTSMKKNGGSWEEGEKHGSWDSEEASKNQ